MAHVKKNVTWKKTDYKKKKEEKEHVICQPEMRLTAMKKQIKNSPDSPASVG